ncbi:hypothetical protein QJS10_CPA07g00334 [Acorus calamus]|uniref:Pre-rRNA-processing protein TSR2 n=1 Tax=Acorus calamus TaxID=4465 RepID=A0AAV9EF91_ACOCL|nr:hypothetical protein QJS10_CPA07g00337 [Acorus calamus]KAK1312175.1 hypothetical protein QJS10_CPA07g00334 [Acorus calamus]
MDAGRSLPLRPPSAALSAEAMAAFEEGTSLVLSRWTALQMAVENKWGGHDSHQKADQLASSLVSWFGQSNAPHYIDELEETLNDYMVLSFRTEIEDDSIGEVAEQLMIMHEDCVQGNYEAIKNMRH